MSPADSAPVIHDTAFEADVVAPVVATGGAAVGVADEVPRAAAAGAAAAVFIVVGRLLPEIQLPPQNKMSKGTELLLL